MSAAQPRNVVVLISASGDILTHFATDRTDFAEVATHDRDRIFKLIFQGDLTSLEGVQLPSGCTVQGAIYKEVEAWRISTRTLDRLRPSKRRRRSAVILAFPQRAGGAV